MSHNITDLGALRPLARKDLCNMQYLCILKAIYTFYTIFSDHTLQSTCRVYLLHTL